MSLPPSSLPIYDIADSFRQVMTEDGLAVLTAPTGSGKSTQIPKMLLDLLPAGQILVLQPRRLAARMLGERVAAECGCQPGELVGYQTKYEKAVSDRTRIIFITEGILTRWLAQSPDLPGISAIIFDEFHERSLNSDLALALACQTRKKHRPDLRILVMSATLDAAPLQEYLGGCQLLQANGRLFPVRISYVSSGGIFQSIQNVVPVLRKMLSLEPDGDILVFLPGVGEIMRCLRKCQEELSGNGLLFLPLFGELPPAEQHQVMVPAPPGKRKIILATNIAQTSLTIPGIRHVIDSGLVRQNIFDGPRGLNRLDLVPIARDAADQRAGRAGREAPGTCVRLWSQLEQNGKQSITTPEIRRVDLAEAVMVLAAYGCQDFADFPWFEKPPQNAWDAALQLLQNLGLLKQEDSSWKLTELGKQTRHFPLHPRLALLLQRGCQMGCPREAATAAAILSERPLLTNGSIDKASLTELRQQAKRSNAALPPSDFLAQQKLLEAARQAHYDRQYCERLGLNPGAARDIGRAVEYLCQFLRNVQQAEDPELAFLQALLLTFPDRLGHARNDGTLAVELQNRKRAELAPTSLVRDVEYLIAGEQREVPVPGTQSVKLQLPLNSGIREEWLWELFPDEFTESDEAFFDERKQQVFRRRTLCCLHLVLEETVSNDPEPEAAAAMLAERIQSHNWHLEGWDETAERWINRVTWLAGQCPNLRLPDCNDRAAVLRSLCQGETSYRAVRSKPCLPALKELLSPEQRRLVDQLAPEALPLPNGRKMKIEYFPQQPPRGRARIQDLYDLRQPAKIVNGTVPILLDILAPNNRTVQITDDLENFWKNHYPALKSALARRYPKHEWR